MTPGASGSAAAGSSGAKIPEAAAAPRNSPRFMATHPLRTTPRRIFRLRLAAAARTMLLAPHDTAATRDAVPDPLIATFAGAP